MTADAPANEATFGYFDAVFTQRYALLRPNPAPRACVMAIHGWGQTCAEFIAWLGPIADAGALVIAPQAPHPFYLESSAKRVGFSWLTAYERDQAVEDLNACLARVLDAVPGAPALPLFLLGYSQGLSVAWRFAVSGRCAPAGIIACNADLPPDVAELLDALPRIAALLVHGQRDAIAPLPVAEAARDVLAAQGIPCETHFHPGGHKLTPGAVRHIASWLASRI